MYKRLFIGILIVLVVVASASRLSSAQDAPLRPVRDLDTGQLPIERAPDSAAQGTQAQSAPVTPWVVTGVADWSMLTYQSYVGNWDIFAANGDGTNAARLTSAGEPDITPRFNRGATRIAYASREPGNYEIYTLNPNGSGKVRVTNHAANDYNPAWSPDGSKIVFNSYRDGQSEIYAMNANGTNLVRLTNNPAYEGQSVWSPDGTKIAFLSDRSGGSRIWVMNADGSGAIQLTAQPYSEDAAWSPDGTQLAYDADADGDGWQELMIVNADGTNPHVIGDTNTTADMWARSWSPDGRSVAFTAIYYVYYQGSWYWTAAYSRALDTITGGIFSLGGSDTDWMPDWQTTDVLPPTSSLAALPSISSGSFTVSWSGTDARSGLANYDVQVKDGAGGVWQVWQTATTSTSGSYSGVGGHTYYFRVRARDNSSNLEAWPATPDTSTTIEALPPVSNVNVLPVFAKHQVVVSWDGYDPGGSNIQAYDIQYRDGLNGTWTNWLTSTLSTKATFSGSGGHTYFFRTRAIDHAQNLENWPAGDGDASTQFYLWAISGTARDNTGTPISGITITTHPMAQATLTSDLDGIYAAYVVTDSAIYTATWSKPGYGSLPPASFEANLVKASSTLRQNLAAYWSLDEPSGTRRDGTGRDNDLQDHNSVSAISGKIGTAAVFSPAAQTYLNHLDNADLSTGDIDFTITGWVYLTDKNSYRVIAGKGTSTIYAGQEFELFYTNNIGTAVDRFGLFVQNGSDQGSVYAEAAGAPALNTWYFITAWHNASENTINIQVNNGAIDSVPWSGGGQDSAAEFALGRRAGTESELYWSGRIDEIGIWKRLLTAEERAALYNGGQGFPFLTAGEGDAQISVVLPPPNNALIGGDFETDQLEPWATNGELTPTLTTTVRHTGRNSVLLGDSESASMGDSILSQVVTLSVEYPVLSFVYQSRYVSPVLMPQTSPGFALEVSDGVTTSTLHTESIATQGWTHRWFDLSAWSGQTVTVTFVVNQGAVYLDDVSIGSAYTDAWASIKAPTTSPRGTQVVYEVNYGNRGGAPTGDTVITATLSTDVIDIQSSLPPLTTTPGLVWAVGNLPAKSDTFTLLITATIAPTATNFSTLVNQVVIEPVSTEIEKLNNSAVTESYVGWRIFLPVIRRS